MPGFFKRRRILSKLNYLEARPLRKAEFEISETGMVTLLIPKFKKEKMRKFLLGRRNPFIHIHLDENGSAVWNEIDGIRPVGEICRILDEKLGEKIQPAEQRVTKFMTMLYEARYISFREIEDN